MAEVWSLVQYRTDGVGPLRGGILQQGKVRSLPAALGEASVLDLVRGWDDVAAILRAGDVGGGQIVPDAELAAPLTYPHKVLGAGANYFSHAAEMGSARPDPQASPFFFLKPPSTTVIGPYDPIPYPPGSDPRLDWEAELAVVIGRRASDVTAGQAPGHIAGYLVANDVSARGRFLRPTAVAAAFAYDWLAQKGHDGFCPLGPGLVPAWLVDDPQRLTLRLWVNGVLKQECSTSDMVVPVYELVAAASRLTSLEPGDVILTGTPAGVGMPRKDFLAPGDEIVVEIEEFGQLRNKVVAR